MESVFLLPDFNMIEKVYKKDNVIFFKIKFLKSLYGKHRDVVIVI